MPDNTSPDCKIQILSANWRDLNPVRQLEQVCFPRDAWPLFDIVGVLTLPNVIRLKAVCGHEMVGFVAADLRQRERLAWIATIGVLPSFRRRGVGWNLMEACEARIDLPAVRLSVRTSNQPAIQMYTSLGYRHIGRWIEYYQDGEDALVMEKVLEHGL